MFRAKTSSKAGGSWISVNSSHYQHISALDPKTQSLPFGRMIFGQHHQIVPSPVVYVWGGAPCKRPLNWPSTRTKAGQHDFTAGLCFGGRPNSRLVYVCPKSMGADQLLMTMCPKPPAHYAHMVSRARDPRIIDRDVFTESYCTH